MAAQINIINQDIQLPPDIKNDNWLFPMII